MRNIKHKANQSYILDMKFASLNQEIKTISKLLKLKVK